MEKYASHAAIAIRSCPSSSVDVAREEALRLHGLGPQVVAVTLGAGGAIVLSGDRVVYAPAAPADVVDTLGAGDAFIARLLVGLVDDEPLADLARAATSYASHSCTSSGAFGYPTATQENTPRLDPIQHGGVESR